MTRRVLVIDTTVLCCWLQVPSKETAGPIDDQWDFNRIDALLSDEKAQGSTFVLPLATLIETGNHIAQSNGDRFALSSKLCELLMAAVDESNPWAAFSGQDELWERDRLQQLSQEWPHLAAGKLSIGDATIKAVAEYYAEMGYTVSIVSGDAGLSAYQPASPVEQPRRRQGR